MVAPVELNETGNIDDLQFYRLYKNCHHFFPSSTQLSSS